MEEPIAKVEWWCLQGASHAHPEGSPEAETSIPVKQGGLGQQRFLCLCSYPSVPKPFQVPSPRPLGLCLRSSHLPFPHQVPAHLLTILFFLGSLSLHALEGRNRWGRGARIWRRAGTLSS